MEYRREIDGLRAFAVIPVILYHAGFTAFRGGFIGVDVFFVISGYLISTILLDDLKSDNFSLARFYERRARRILPALFFVMLACLPFAWLWLLPQHLTSFSESLTSAALFYANMWLWSTSSYFDIANELRPLLHTWSLSLEEQYYVLYPLFLMILWRVGKDRLAAALFTVAIASALLAQYCSTRHPTANFYCLPTRAWELMIGALVALYFPEHRIRSQKYINSEICSLVGFALICYSIFAYNDKTPFPSVFTLFPTIGTALIIIFSSGNTAVGNLLGSRPCVAIGLISYSAYLWHQPIFAFARQRSLVEPSSLFMITLMICSLLLAYLTWRYVERPFRDRCLLSRNQVYTFALTGSFAFAAIGVAGTHGDGFPERLNYSSSQGVTTFKIISDNRFAMLLSDECHFTNRSGIGVAGFIKRWNCKFRPTTLSSRRIPVVVAGDSNAADLAGAFRLNGLVPGQMTGSGCVLIPSEMTNCQGPLSLNIHS